MQSQTYTDPLTLDAARRYIAEHTVMLGAQIHDCVGIVLEDAEDRIIPFDPPIQVRA
ncbi:MAG: hypothetical protein Q8R16_05295 [bacterium]|nr:hypothetical protein [bacterium]